MENNNEKPQGPKWYVAHTYSGYENKVKINIEAVIEKRNLQDQILEVKVPVHEVTEIKDGVSKVKSKKTFPGYILVNMVMNQYTWYVVRNTRGVTGFVGPGSEPVPLSDEEVLNLGIKPANFEFNIEVGEDIIIINGALKDTVGKIESINEQRQMVRVSIEMFGTVQSVEVGMLDVKKI